MKIQNKLNYSSVPPLGSYALLSIRCAVRFLRDLKTERAVAKANERVINRRRQSGNPIKLDMGAGLDSRVNGWTTVDLAPGCDLRLDLSEPLPLGENQVDEIYASHLLEHFNYRDLMKMLADWHRVLRPAGRIRVAVPNARIFINAYVSDDRFDQALFCQYKPALHYNTRIDYLNYMAYMDGHHRHMFDEENLLAILRAGGFSEASLRKFDPEVDLEKRKYESIYAIAIK